MKHAVTEHRDFRLLDVDFVASGGDLEVIQNGEKNIGSEALSRWMFHEAGKPNPFGLLGAMWIIEGLGSIKAQEWGRRVKETLGLPDEAVRFLLYHGENDAQHIQGIQGDAGDGCCRMEPSVNRIVRTAQVTRLGFTLCRSRKSRPDRMDIRTFDVAKFDPNNPDPWLALYLDQSLPIDESRQAGPAGRQPFGVAPLAVSDREAADLRLLHRGEILRGLSPNHPNMNVALHKLIYWGLKNFASPEANMLILRHFTLATELLAFIKTNAGDVTINSWPLRPTRLEDLRDNVFLQHDLNIYNFIIQLNASLRAQGRDLMPVANPDFFSHHRWPGGACAFAQRAAQRRRRADRGRGLYAALCAVPAARGFRARGEFIAARRGDRDLYRENSRHRLSPGLHEERPSAGAAVHPPGRLSADDARARCRRPAWLAARAEAAPAGGPAGRSASAAAGLKFGQGRFRGNRYRYAALASRDGSPASRAKPALAA